MTNQEAIKKLKKLVVVEISDSPRLAKENKARNEALTISIQALEKQMLKKPKIDGKTTMYYVCPVCGSELLKGFDCYKCHQVINWSEE